MVEALLPEIARIALCDVFLWLCCHRLLQFISNGQYQMSFSARSMPFIASAAFGLMISTVATLLTLTNAGLAQEPPAWRLICTEENNASTCRMNQQLFLRQTVEGELQTVGRLLNLTVIYLDANGERLPFMSVQMPLGMDLRVGGVMRVDEESETLLEFLRCTEAGCDASAPVTPELLAQMRAGAVLRVGFLPWGREQVTAVDASLAGFTAAFERLQ